MAKTLTITLEDERMARAEALAAARGMTVDEWASRLLRIVTDPPPKLSELPPITRSALGMLKDVPDRPYKQLVEEAILEKYGLPE